MYRQYGSWSPAGKASWATKFCKSGRNFRPVARCAPQDSRRIRRRGVKKSFAVTIYRRGETDDGATQPASANGLRAMGGFMRQLIRVTHCGRSETCTGRTTSRFKALGCVTGKMGCPPLPSRMADARREVHLFYDVPETIGGLYERELTLRAYLSADGEYLNLVLPGNMRVRKHKNFFPRNMILPAVFAAKPRRPCYYIRYHFVYQSFKRVARERTRILPRHTTIPIIYSSSACAYKKRSKKCHQK